MLLLQASSHYTSGSRPFVRTPIAQPGHHHHQQNDMHTELTRAHETIASLRSRLEDNQEEVQRAQEEREGSQQALEEAHRSVSDYHRKLCAMERTVGNALVSRAEVKEMMQTLQESEALNRQYKTTLDAAEARLAALQDSERNKSDQLQELTGALQGHEALIRDLQVSRQIAEELRDAHVSQNEDLKQRLQELQSEASRLAEDNEELDRQHGESLAALSDLVAIQKSVEAEKERLAGHVLDLKELNAQQEVSSVLVFILEVMAW